MRPRPRDPDEQATETLTEFAALLIAALDIPEVQDAIRRALPPPSPPRQQPAVSPAPVRGRGGRRRG